MDKNDHIHPVNVDFFEDLTGDVSGSKDVGIEAIGERIKSLREKKGLSLEDLSKMTGFDIDLLESIEENKVQPQLGTIIKLSKALDSALGRLLSGVGNKIYSITRKNQQKIIFRSTSKKGEKQVYTYKSLAPEVQGRHMEALMVQLDENPDHEISVHDGEEFIYVLSGIIQLKIGDEQFELEPGDSVYYLSTTPHLVSSKVRKATILAVLYQG
ncbi:MAG: helix-turn-helix transcriptional regulator [Deltaproteobacteria bacterium]|nr:helix-turn-helix transcriptional regulator [Deltaproteobacteria bacterium]